MSAHEWDLEGIDLQVAPLVKSLLADDLFPELRSSQAIRAARGNQPSIIGAPRHQYARDHTVPGTLARWRHNAAR